MANLAKITSTNFKPGTGDDRFPVYSKQFNDLVDNLTDGDVDVEANNLTVNNNLVVTGTSTFNGAITLGDAAADSLTVTAVATYGEPINYDATTSVVAFATGGQGSATALTAEINNVTTCATAGDSVKLPVPPTRGTHVWIKNSGAAALDIFPSTGVSIDALAVNLAVRIQPGSTIEFYAKSSTVWESDKDQSLTLVAPTTNTGQLELKAANSAGNTVTTITNASQAAARTYTVPDAGASASFVMTEGAQTLNGIKTLADATDATSSTVGGTVVSGGIAVAKVAYLGTNVTMSKEVNHTVSVATTTTAATVGGTLQIDAGAGATTGNGGPLWLNGGTSGAGGATGTGGATALSGGASVATNGNGGNASVIGGAGSGTNQGGQGLVAGGAGGATGTGGTAKVESGAGGATSGASGAIEFVSGAVTNATSGTASNTGAISISTGTAGTATTGTAGNTGSITFRTTGGGAASGAAGIGGNGGAVAITSGDGGASSSATGGVPGISGALSLTGGAGGAAAGTGVAGGAATACTITTGNGGASTHAAGGVGGAGAALTVTAGNGGAVTNAGVAGGVGGSVSIVAGNAGAGSTAGSDAGNISLTPGNPVGTAGKRGHVKIDKGLVQEHTVKAAINSSATATVLELATGYITSTSAAGTTITLPTGTLFGAELGATQGTTFDFIIDNTAGANTVTVAVGVNMIVSAWTAVDDALLAPLDVPSGVTGIGIYRIVFSSATAATFSRIG